MNRTLGLILVFALLAVGFVAFTQPDLFPGAAQTPRLVWLLMALMLVAGSGYGFSRLKFDSGRALLSLLFWAALIAAIALLYWLFN